MNLSVFIFGRGLSKQYVQTYMYTKFESQFLCANAIFIGSEHLPVDFSFQAD